MREKDGENLEVGSAVRSFYYLSTGLFSTHSPTTQFANGMDDYFYFYSLTHLFSIPSDLDALLLLLPLLDTSHTTISIYSLPSLFKNRSITTHTRFVYSFVYPAIYVFPTCLEMIVLFPMSLEKPCFTLTFLHPPPYP